MPKYRSHQSSFSFGEVSRKVDGRTDLESYRKSCKRLKNFINMASGGITKRYGTKLINELNATGTGTFFHEAYVANSVLIPYSQSNGEEFMIVLAPGNGGAATAINMSTKRQFLVTNTEYTTTTGFTSSKNNSYEGYTTSTDTSKFQYSQRGDFLYIAHPDFPPFIIQRGADGEFGIIPYAGVAARSDAEEWESLPYLDINQTGITLTGSATTGSITLTASADLFTSDSVGTLYAIHDGGGNVGYVVVSAYASATSVTALVLSTLPGTTAYATWYESAWSNSRGWPRTVSHVNSRVIYGGTTHKPDTFWLSQEGDLFQMAQKEVDHALTEARTNDDHFTFTLNVGKLSEINWIKADQGRIAFGTSDTEFTLFAPDNTTALGALNLQVSVETSYGSEPIQAPYVGSKPIFVQRGGQKIRDFFYSREANGYVSSELTTLGEHFTRKSIDAFVGASLGKVKQIVFQKANDEIVWVIDTNNYLYGFTKSESNDIISFHDHQLGGSTVGVAADVEPPKVISMAVNKAASGTHDELWLLVQRTVNSVTKITLEYIGREFVGSGVEVASVDIEDHPVFLDCAQLLKKEEPDMYISYDTSLDADSSEGSGTGTGTGSPATPAGDLDLSGGGVKYVSYDGTANVDVAQIGCVRMKFKPDFGFGQLAAKFVLFSISKANADADNLIELSLQRPGTYEELHLTIKDSAGANIINDITLGVLTGHDIGTIMESGIGQGKFVEIELNYDLDAGATRVFINGVQIGATDTSTGTRDTSIDLLRIGSDYAGGDAADGFIKDVQFYPTVQHTADYKPLLYWDGTTAVKGLDAYEAESVKVLRDGRVEAAKTVTSGAITLDEAGDYLLVGYTYTALVETMEIEDGSAIGSAQGGIKRLDKAFPRFYKTSNASVGSDYGDVDPIEFRDSTDDISEPISLKTGIRDADHGVDLDLSSNRQATFYLESSSPLPCSLVSVTVRGVTGD